MVFTNTGAHRVDTRQTPELAALISVIHEQRAAIAGLEASRTEMESVIELLLSAGKRDNPGSSTVEKGSGLSKRELQVLELMVAGKTSKEIAASLGISFKTAVTHRANIMSKMNVHETASVVREALRRHWI
jgi:DNA-binding NarL/FixJ family response regulator